MSAIISFQAADGQHTALSNFYPSPLKQDYWDGFTAETLLFPTVEHFFQAQKTTHLDEQQRVAQAATPGLARRIGRSVTLRRDWEAVKLNVMRSAIDAKFSLNDPLSDTLLATEDLYLVEGNTWGDRFWGQVNGQGLNWLGVILMARRAELRYQRELL